MHADYQDAVVTVLNNESKNSKFDTRYNSQVINFRNSNGSFKSPNNLTMKTPRGEITADDIPKIPLNSDYTDITAPILSEDQLQVTCNGSLTTKSTRPFGQTMSVFTSPRGTLGTS